MRLHKRSQQQPCTPSAQSLLHLFCRSGAADTALVPVQSCNKHPWQGLLGPAAWQLGEQYICHDAGYFDLQLLFMEAVRNVSKAECGHIWRLDVWGLVKG